MKILLDTNILIDFFAKREPFYQDAEKIFELCQQEKVQGAIAVHSILNMAYILRKNFTLAELKEIFSGLCKIFKVESIDSDVIFQAIADDNFADFEDCLQEKCALNFAANFIITRNLDDFKDGKLPALSPTDFVKLFEDNSAE